MIDTVSECTRKWNDRVAAGGIQSTIVLEMDRRIGDRECRKGEKIVSGLKLVDGEPMVFAIVEGEEQEIQFAERPIERSPFVIIINELRVLRPGAPKEPPIGRQPDFVSPGENGCLFQCCQARTELSILRRVPLMDVRLKHKEYAVLPNAAFFDRRGHFLLVPVVKSGEDRTYPHGPQRLTLPALEDMHRFQDIAHDHFVIYNSIHGGATVDHPHIQSVYYPGLLAIELAPTIRMGDVLCLGEEYPARGLAFKRDEEPINIYRYIARCQDRGIPFNVIVTANGTYLIPRDRDHEIVAEFPTGVLAAMEMAGRGITDDKKVFELVTLETIESALRKTTIKDMTAIFS